MLTLNLNAIYDLPLYCVGEPTEPIYMLFFSSNKRHIVHELLRCVFFSPFIPTWFIYLRLLQQVTIQHNFDHILFQQSAHLHTVNFHDAIDKYHKMKII